MANNSGNLIPASRLPAEERKRLGSKGGKASAAARKRRKATNALIKELLSARVQITREMTQNLINMGYDFDAEGDPTMELAALVNIANTAMSGEGDDAWKALGFLYDYGQVPNMKAKLERERLRAMKDARLRVDLAAGEEEEAAMAEIRARMAAEADPPPPAGAQPREAPAPLPESP